MTMTHRGLTLVALALSCLGFFCGLAAAAEKMQGDWRIVDLQSRSYMLASSPNLVVKSLESYCTSADTFSFKVHLAQPQAGTLRIGDEVRASFDATGLLSFPSNEVVDFMKAIFIAEMSSKPFSPAVNGQIVSFNVRGYQSASEQLMKLCAGKTQIVGATAEKKVPAVSSASTSAHSSYPFEGYWQPDAAQVSCTGAKKFYSHAAILDVDVPPGTATKCNFKSVTMRNAASFVVALSCPDESGDGPSTYLYKEEITLQDTNTMTIKSKDGQTIYKRCPADSVAMKAQQQSSRTAQSSTSSPPPRAPTQSPLDIFRSSESPPSASIIDALVSGSDGGLRQALRTDLPDWSCSANDDVLTCRKGNFQVIASAKTKSFQFFAEMAAHPEMYVASNKPIFDIVDKLGLAIGLTGSDINSCFWSRSVTNGRKRDGLISACAGQTDLSKQIVLQVKPDNSF